MTRISTWVNLCVATAVVAGVMYWMYNAGMLAHRVSPPVYSSLVVTFLPGVVAGMMTVNVHDGFGTGFSATVLTGLCSGVVWGTLLFVLPLFVRSMGRGLLRRA